ncbi:MULTISPECIES: N-acetylmuramoyl-L-alanine amidase [unclassified Thioalkalivibrio]|uniref:N-acetylmuramoyl-L-alanine amidase n=1 Tax=unclassified Thioalkalivibrio TaxID=2621013 RepID=UPI00037386B2|nr:MULTISPECIES: N-acetylmuramoyl-L-alanine amidase [unclassified Thioalkalivibrio]
MNRMVDHLIIHCSATRPSQDIGAEDIDRWHRALGWWGCGYHYVIRRDGTIESAAEGHRCRPLERAGAHVGDCGPGWNGRTIAVCMAGGIDDKKRAEDNFTPEQYDSLEALVMFILHQHPTITHIGGHRDLIKVTGAPPKDCPCFEVSDWYKGIVDGYPDHEVAQAVQFIGK